MLNVSKLGVWNKDFHWELLQFRILLEKQGFVFLRKICFPVLLLQSKRSFLFEIVY